jgi:large subunit ribosomal protein L19e
MDPAKIGEVAQAITTSDVRRLVSSGIIKALPKTGLSSWRKKYIAHQKTKGRRKGKGSRKGKIGSRFSRKSAWISSIRAQRKHLKEMLKSGKFDKKVYKNMYRKAGGGYFRSRAHINVYVEDMTKGAEEKAKPVKGARK